MSSSSRILAAPPVSAQARPLGAPAPALDRYTAGLLDRAEAAAYERGRRDGAAEARAAAAAAAERLSASVRAACQEVLAQAGAGRAEQAAVAADLATEIAAAVLGREPHDGGVALLGRVRDALAEVVDERVVVAVHPDDEPVLAAALSSDCVVEADPSLRPGEARLRGDWMRGDLTREAALEAIRAALDGWAPDA